MSEEMYGLRITLTKAGQYLFILSILPTWWRVNVNCVNDVTAPRVFNTKFDAHENRNVKD